MSAQQVKGTSRALLEAKHQDALNDWRRLRRRVEDEQLTPGVETLEVAFLEAKYGRYYARCNDSGLPNVAAPWRDNKQKNTKELPTDENGAICVQPTCRRPWPLSEDLNIPLTQCGVCAAKIDPEDRERGCQAGEPLISCKFCKHDLCKDCGRAWCERVCRICEKVVGVPPSEKLANTTEFCCWACGANQEERIQLKLGSSQKRGEQRKEFRCSECTVAICVECAKPYEYPFDPDYGFIRNRWYKFIDNVWDPPEAHDGFEKYLRRERRLGIPQFDLEDLYTPAYLVDPNDDDTALYDGVAPKHTQVEATPSSITVPNTQQKGYVMDNEDIDSESNPSKSRHPTRNGRDHKIRRVDFGRQIPPPQGYDDFWYAENNRRLYDMACQWSEKYFAKRNFPRKYNDKTWLSRFNDQFIQYSNMVAYEDSFFGPVHDGRRDGWEHILRDRNNRKWLVVSILSAIIGKKINVELLFGATEEQIEALGKQDSDNLDNDGFHRAAARSQLINMMLGRKVVPVNFQQRVDELTSYTAKIFQELFSLTNVRDEGDRIVEMDKNVRKEDMAFMYSELHFIISHAAYLAVCIRRSSSIFHFLSGSPAARMSFENEGQACYDLYNLSRVHYEELERAESAKDKQDIHEIETIGGMTPEKIVEAKRAIRIRAHHRTRGARIKFAVWPMITRYKAENIGRPVVRPARFSYFDDPEDRANAPTQNEVEGGEGQRVVEIGKCVVVYYQGIIYPEPGPAGVTFHRDGRHLLPYIASEKPGRDIDIWKGRAKAQFLARILTMALFGILYNHRVQLRESSFSIVVVTLASVSVYLSTTSNQLRNNIRKITIPALIAIVLGMRQRAGPMSGLTQLFEPLQVLWSTAWEHLWTSLTIGLFTVIVGLALPPSRNWTTATRFSVLGFLFLAYTCQPLLGAFLYWSGFWSQIQAIVVASSPYVTE